MLGLIFPEKLKFFNNSFQTVTPNEILTLLCIAGKGFGNGRNEKSSGNAAQSCVVTPTGQFSNQLLERFRKIYELKAVMPVQMLQPAVMPRKLKVA